MSRLLVPLAAVALAAPGLLAGSPPVPPAGGPPGLAPTLAASAVLPVVLPAGDVDADGTGDLLAVHPWAAATTTLSGIDGRTLGASQGWQATHLDVTGDGRPDVLRLSVASRTVEQACDELGRCDRTTHWSWRVSAHPAVGSPATWSFDVPAALVEEHNAGGVEGDVVRRRRAWTGAADHLEVRILADHGRRPGRGRVVVTSRSTEGTLAYRFGPGTLRGEPTVDQAVHRAEVASLDAAGRVVVRRPLDVGPGHEEYLPLGDVDGDGGLDLALLEPQAEGTGLNLRLGSPLLEQRWGAVVHQGSRLEPAPSARGRTRVARVDPGVVAMLDAATGAEMWRSSNVRVATGRTPSGLRAVAYEAVADREPDGRPRSFSLRLGGYDLATGTFTGFTRVRPLGEFADGNAPGSFAGFDVDGNGELDLVGQEYVPGLTGGRLLALTDSGTAFLGPKHDLAVPWFAVELDGIPGTEVVWKSFSPTDGAWTGVFGWRPGQRMWSVDRARFDRLASLPSRTGADWAEAGLDASDDVVVRGLDGVTLDVRWTARLSAGTEARTGRG